MSNVIDFPVIPKGPGRDSVYVAPTFAETLAMHHRQREIPDFNTKARAAIKQFRADLYLVNGGKDVAFSLLFPAGPVSREVVANMLRRAALEIDPPKA